MRFLFAFALIGDAVDETATLPAQKKAYQQKMAHKATVREGDIYFVRYRIYKEKGNMLGSEGGFGWFKVVRIENGTYHISKSVEISDTAKPNVQMNTSNFQNEHNAKEQNGRAPGRIRESRKT